MIQVGLNSKIVKTVYRLVLPFAVVLLLFGIASFNSRQHLFGSASADIIVRCMITLWFCGLYIRLSRLSSYSFFPNKKWSKADVGGIEKYFYISLCFLFSIGCGVITWWAIQWFLPNFSDFAIVITVLNSLIVLVPMATQYWVFKL